MIVKNKCSAMDTKCSNKILSGEILLIGLASDLWIFTSNLMITCILDFRERNWMNPWLPHKETSNKLHKISNYHVKYLVSFKLWMWPSKKKKSFSMFWWRILCMHLKSIESRSFFLGKNSLVYSFLFIQGNLPNYFSNYSHQRRPVIPLCRL